LVNVHNPTRIELSHIAIIAALPPILFSSTRLYILKSVDLVNLAIFCSHVCFNGQRLANWHHAAMG
jgi:hypothetical protein